MGSRCANGSRSRDTPPTDPHRNSNTCQHWEEEGQGKRWRTRMTESREKKNTCPLINHLNPVCWFSNIILLLHLATSGQPEQMVHCRVSPPVTALSRVWNLTKLTERFEDHDLVKFAVILGSGDTCPLSSLTNLIFPHRSSALTSGDCYWGRKVISSCVCKVCLTATFSWASLEKILCSLHENHS